MGGENLELELAGVLNGRVKNLSDPGTSPPPSPSRSSSSGKKSVIQRAPARPTPFPGFLPGASGGYIGTDGQADWSMEREMEILRLEEENHALRDMLAIAEESAHMGGEDPLLLGSEREKLGGPVEVARKGSLTVEQLELGAEQEAAEQEARANELPGTGLGGETGVITQDLHDGSVPRVLRPEQAIDDGPD